MEQKKVVQDYIVYRDGRDGSLVREPAGGRTIGRGDSAASAGAGTAADGGTLWFSGDEEERQPPAAATEPEAIEIGGSDQPSAAGGTRPDGGEGQLQKPVFQKL
jgi:hypothetical protein